MNRFFSILFILFCLIAGNKAPAVVSENVDLKKVTEEPVKLEAEASVTEDDKGLFEKIFDAEDDIEVEFSFFDAFDFDDNNDGKIDEDTLIGKIIHRDIVRTDIPSYLLRHELTYKPQKGAISRIEYFGAYRGGLNADWNDGDYDTTYDINSLQFGVLGKFRNSKTDFKISVNPRPSSERNYFQNFLADAYIVNSSIPNHKILIGHSRNLVGKEGGSSSYILPFVSRSQIARNFGSTRALGIRLVGNYSLIDYNLSLNSSDRYFHTPFAGPEFTGWVDLKPFGKTDGKYGQLTIGGGLNAGHNNTTYTVGSAYIGYRYKKLWTNFEYGIADGYNGKAVSTNKAEGFNYTLGYKVHPRLQLIARYDQFDPNRDGKNDLRREYTAGINWFLKGQALRLILNYVFCENQNRADSHRIILGTQILL